MEDRFEKLTKTTSGWVYFVKYFDELEIKQDKGNTGATRPLVSSPSKIISRQSGTCWFMQNAKPSSPWWPPSRQDHMVDHSNNFSVTFTVFPLLPGLIYSSLGVNQSEPSHEALSPELNEEK